LPIQHGCESSFETTAVNGRGEPFLQHQGPSTDPPAGKRRGRANRLKPHPKGERPSFEEAFDRLVGDVGLEGETFRESILWALVEERIRTLTPTREQLMAWRNARDGLNSYWNFVEGRTGRQWEGGPVRRHWERIVKDSERHARIQISLEDRMRLFFSSPRVCNECGGKPPTVKLHVDHKEPVARGGGSHLNNLQFLCEGCNLTKGKRLEGREWLEEYLC
jgi:HNH endonuclease